MEKNDIDCQPTISQPREFNKDRRRVTTTNISQPRRNLTLKSCTPNKDGQSTTTSISQSRPYSNTPNKDRRATIAITSQLKQFNKDRQDIIKSIGQSKRGSKDDRRATLASFSTRETSNDRRNTQSPNRLSRTKSTFVSSLLLLRISDTAPTCLQLYPHIAVLTAIFLVLGSTFTAVGTGASNINPYLGETYGDMFLAMGLILVSAGMCLLTACIVLRIKHNTYIKEFKRQREEEAQPEYQRPPKEYVTEVTVNSVDSD